MYVLLWGVVYLAGLTVLWIALSALVWVTLTTRDTLTAGLVGGGLLAASMATVFAVAYWRERGAAQQMQTVRESLVPTLVAGTDPDPEVPEVACVGALVVNAFALSAWFYFAAQGSAWEQAGPVVIAALVGPSLLLTLSVMLFQRPRWLLPYDLRVRHARAARRKATA